MDNPLLGFLPLDAMRDFVAVARRMQPRLRVFHAAHPGIDVRMAAF